jgi:hypothetical protein
MPVKNAGFDGIKIKLYPSTDRPDPGFSSFSIFNFPAPIPVMLISTHG